MICKLCGNDLPDSVELMPIYKPSKIEGHSLQIEVCGRCFLLCSIMDQLSLINKILRSNQWQTSKASITNLSQK